MLPRIGNRLNEQRKAQDAKRKTDSAKRTALTHPTDTDVAERDVIAVVLQCDMPLARLGEFRIDLEFAFSDSPRHLFTVQLTVDDFYAVDPVLNMRATDDQAHMVELAPGLDSAGDGCSVCGASASGPETEQAATENQRQKKEIPGITLVENRQSLTCIPFS